jgi:hypothetical protein
MESLIRDMPKGPGPIPSRVLKKSLDSVLSVLGLELTDVIFADMWRSGIVFGRNRAYPLKVIYDYFEQTLGKYAADLLVSKLQEELAQS